MNKMAMYDMEGAFLLQFLLVHKASQMPMYIEKYR